MNLTSNVITPSFKFGTRGLRGLALELNGVPAFAYTRAFAEMLKGDGSAAAARNIVLVGRDLRESSSSIAQMCCAALRESNLIPIDCGTLPVPALVYHGMDAGIPAIMVTGSHLPEDRNGLRFYRAEGEITTKDEAGILTWHDRLGIVSVPESAGTFQAKKPNINVVAAYKARYQRYFREDALSGLTVGVYQHSSAARDVMVQLLQAFGAQAVPFGRAEKFIPISPGTLREEDEALARHWAAEQKLDAIVSTNTDADEPLIAGAAGRFLRGDLVGAITAQHLSADVIVTPQTSILNLEESGVFKKVIRTHVGSSYMIEAMAEAASSGAHAIVGFEANGSVILGSDIVRAGRILSEFPSRDAMLPILCVLGEVVAQGRLLAQVADGFTFKTVASKRLKNIEVRQAPAS